MVEENKIWLANVQTSGEHSYLYPKMANRHGLVSGATGTGKTVTLKVLAESFSDMGVPVFLADVKGDLAGMVNPGVDSDDMKKRIEKYGLADSDFNLHPYPVTFWDIFGKNGIQLRTTISEMGPLLLSRLMGLNSLQSDILTIAFKIADDNELLLVDTKDLKALLGFISENAKDFAKDYGNMSTTSIATIIRAVVSLELIGGETFFGETALNITDWFTTDSSGKGMIHILDSQSLINNPKLYSTFLLWMLSEMFETLPEVGDLEKPKMVFFFDEAHLLFNDAPKSLLEKIDQVVKLIRSKGIGIYFVTQNPRDIPDSVLSQLGNKIIHGLRAYTPADQKQVKAISESFRVNPDFNIYETMLNLGTAEAVVSFLDEKGIPTVAQKVNILPPQSQMGGIDSATRESATKSAALYTKYSVTFDPDSAYEFLQRRGVEKQESEQKQSLQSKPAAKMSTSRTSTTKPSSTQKAAKTAAKNTGKTMMSTIGREVGKSLGSNFGSVGKKLGGNLGASLGRGLLSTLFSK